MIKIFNLHFHKRTLLQIAFDLALIALTVTIAALLQVSNPVSMSSSVVSGAILLAMGVLTINLGLGFYRRDHVRTMGHMRLRAVLSLCLSLPLAFGIYRLSPIRLENEKVFVIALVGGVLVVLLHRIYTGTAAPRERLCQRVLVYGSGARAMLVGRTLKINDPNVCLVGYYASPNEDVSGIPDAQLLSPDKSLTDVVHEHRVDEIVVALTERRGGSMPLRELLDCKLHGVHVVDTATHFEKAFGQIRRDSVSAGWLVFGDGFEQGLLRTLSKRLFDMVCTTILILLAWPVMLLTALLIYLESGGPVLYFQERVGLNGRLFNIVKFRSMRTDAELDGKPRWASVADDRITRVGRVIRKLRIDELPQLINVLIGDMSLVGPRPERPFFVDKLTQELPYYAVRQSVKPGITGWAQVRYHYGASVDDAAEKLQYDLYYVKNHTLFLDLVVLFETVGVVLLGIGAQ